MLLDIEGRGLTLYDPEIVTTGERFFCGGNLNEGSYGFVFRKSPL